MKFFALLVVSLFCFSFLFSQELLPPKTYSALRDSTTSLDIVIMQGKGGSLSIEGRNLQVFNSFFENKTAVRQNFKAAGNMMWLTNGREFISGNYFLGDTTGYIIFKKEEKEYIHLINAQGNSFLKSQIKN
jgi:hypothetical protein